MMLCAGIIRAMPAKAVYDIKTDKKKWLQKKNL